MIGYHQVTVIMLLSGKPCPSTRLILGAGTADDLAAWVVSKGGKAVVEVVSQVVHRDDSEIQRGQAILTEYVHSRR